MLGADRPVYATPLENLRAAQAAAEELNGLGADELPYMTRRIQQLIDAAAERHEAGARADSHPPRREHAATSRSPTASGARQKKDKELAASRSRTRITIERDAEGRPRAVEHQGNLPPPRLEESDVSPRRLSRTRLLATDSAAEKESARTTPATGSTALLDPWR